MRKNNFYVFRQICLLLNPADVYRSLAVLLSSCINYEKDIQINSLFKIIKKESTNSIPLLLECHQNDLDFIGKMVSMLSRILLTTYELFHLRQCLRNPDIYVYLLYFIMTEIYMA